MTISGVPDKPGIAADVFEDDRRGRACSSI